MELNVKELIETALEKLKSDDNVRASFKKDPIKTVESILGVDLPDEKLQAVVEGIKAKLGTDGFFAKIAKLFGKK